MPLSIGHVMSQIVESPALLSQQGERAAHNKAAFWSGHASRLVYGMCLTVMLDFGFPMCMSLCIRRGCSRAERLTTFANVWVRGPAIMFICGANDQIYRRLGNNLSRIGVQRSYNKYR